MDSVPEILYPDCDYFNDKRDDEFAPQFGDCQSCYRYSICLNAYIKENKGERCGGTV